MIADESPGQIAVVRGINRRDRACSGVIAFTYASSAAAPVGAAVRAAFGGRSDDAAARLFRGAVRSAASAQSMIAAARDAIPPHASSALAPDDEAPPSPPLPPPPLSSALLPSAALVVASASRALEAKNTACRDHTEIFAEMMPKMCPPGGHSPGYSPGYSPRWRLLAHGLQSVQHCPCGAVGAGQVRRRGEGGAERGDRRRRLGGRVLVGSHLGCISARSRVDSCPHDQEHGTSHTARVTSRVYLGEFTPARPRASRSTSRTARRVIRRRGASRYVTAATAAAGGTSQRTPEK